MAPSRYATLWLLSTDCLHWLLRLYIPPPLLPEHSTITAEPRAKTSQSPSHNLLKRSSGFHLPRKLTSLPNHVRLRFVRPCRPFAPPRSLRRGRQHRPAGCRFFPHRPSHSSLITHVPSPKDHPLNSTPTHKTGPAYRTSN